MDYRIFFKETDKTISPWHDIPLSAGGNLYNFVCEIPKETDAKMECATVRPSISILYTTYPHRPWEPGTRGIPSTTPHTVSLVSSPISPQSAQWRGCYVSMLTNAHCARGSSILDAWRPSMT